MKILFSPSKEMNHDNLTNQENNINCSDVVNIIDYIKEINREESYNIFKTKEDLFDTHQNINIYSKKAIELYSGIAFRQLDLTNVEKYKDLCILSALYGISFADDYISPFRYDYTMKNSKTYRKNMYNEINELLSQEDFIYNLASKEFSEGIEHCNLIDFNFYTRKNNKLTMHSVASKKNRGQMVNYIIENNGNNLEDYEYDGYTYDKELSSEKEYVYVKNTD